MNANDAAAATEYDVIYVQFGRHQGHCTFQPMNGKSIYKSAQKVAYFFQLKVTNFGLPNFRAFPTQAS